MAITHHRLPRAVQSCGTVTPGYVAATEPARRHQMAFAAKLQSTIMRATIISLTLMSLFLAGPLNPTLAQPAPPAPAAPGQSAPVQPVPRRGGPCAQIAAACKQAGFVPQGAKSGVGIVVDCIRPIMVGTPQGVQGTKPLPQIDPQVVAACKQQNPNFGTARRANPQPSGQSTTKPSGM